MINRYLLPPADFFIRCAVSLVLMFPQPTLAQSDRTQKFDPAALIGASPLCNKSASPLNSGNRVGRLKNIEPSVLTHDGPSVICPSYKAITQTDRFTVLGESQSSFKKPWYQIRIHDAQSTIVWIPAKYVVFTQLSNSLKFTSEDLEHTFVTPTISLNVRACPSTSCQKLSSAIAGHEYTAFKRANNGWYQIEVTKELRGWIGGRNVTADIQKPIENPQEPTANIEPEETNAPNNPTWQLKINKPATNLIPVVSVPPVKVEFVDPCTMPVDLKPYQQKHIWRAQQSIQVNAAPHEGCAIRDTINKGRALVVLGEAEGYFQLAYLNKDSDDYTLGYLKTSENENRYTPMDTLSTPFTADHIASQLRESERYWASWQYAVGQIWRALTNKFRQNPFGMTLLTAALLITFLFAIPKTRPTVIALAREVQKIVQNIIALLIAALVAIGQTLQKLFWSRKLRTISSHWHTKVEGLNISPKEYYAALQANINDKDVPDAKHFRIEWKEGGIFSAKRLYLRVKRKEYVFDICGAPFGKGMFFSWWAGELPRGFLALMYMLPIMSWLAYFYEKLIKPETFYKVDTMLMFQGFVHGAVQEVLDSYTNSQGLRALTEFERRPTMKTFFSGTN